MCICIFIYIYKIHINPHESQPLAINQSILKTNGSSEVIAVFCLMVVYVFALTLKQITLIAAGLGDGNWGDATTGKG